MMQRAKKGSHFIRNNNSIIGINLGYLSTECHKIEQLEKDFGINLGKKYGFDARRNTKVPEEFIYYGDNALALIYSRWLNPKQGEINKSHSNKENLEEKTRQRFDDILKRDLYFTPNKELITAWSDSEFGVHIASEYKPVLLGLYKAFKSKKGVIMLGDEQNVFGDNGLMLLDYTKIPKAIKKEFKEKDMKIRKELREKKLELKKKQDMYRKMEKEHGELFDLLDLAGKKYVSLKIVSSDLSGNPLWELEPSEQDVNKAGRYITKDLEDWAFNKGPICVRNREK